MNFASIQAKPNTHLRTKDTSSKKYLVIYDVDTCSLKVIVGNSSYPLFKFDNIIGSNIKFTTPSNDKYKAWQEFKNDSSEIPSRIDLIKPYWWRYRPGLTIYGAVENNIFYEQGISRDITD